MEIGAVIVAAGMSSRMGDFKAMLSIGEISVAQRVVATLRQAGAERVVVVTGYNADELERHLARSGAVFVRNENYRTTENALLNISYQFPLSDVYNAITVTGATLNGVQVKGYAENTDARSGTSINRIGAKHYSESQTSYYSDSQCQEMAQYLLEQKSTLLTTTTIDSIPIYHMRENTLVTLERPEVSTAIDTYLVTGYSMPIGQTGSMSISAVQVYGGGK